MSARDEAALEQSMARNWEEYWAKTLPDTDTVAVPERAAGLKRILRRAGSFELTCRLVSRALGRPRNALILEAGSGSGEISLRLASQGNRLILLDTSLAGLRYSKSRATQMGLDVLALRGSIFHLPLRSSVCDGVFNVGVLDHFGPNSRLAAAKEMLSVTKPGRRAAILVNDARSLIHPRAMRFAKRKGWWPHGVKFSIRSLRDAVETIDPCADWREYSRGFISQFEFIRYYFPPKSRALRLFYWLFFVISFPLSLLNYFPGQYLVTVIEKADAS